MDFHKKYHAVMCKEMGTEGYVKKYGTLELDHKGGSLSGKMFPVSFWLDSFFRGGSVSGNQIRFTVYTSTPCQQYSMEVEAEMKENEIVGICHTPLGEFRLEGKEI